MAQCCHTSRVLVSLHQVHAKYKAKQKHKIKALFATISIAASAAASNIITVSTSSTMWLSTLSQEGPALVFHYLSLSLPLFTFCTTPLIPATHHWPPSCPFSVSIFTPPQLPACPLPSLSVPARHGRFLGVQTRSSHGNRGPSAVSSHSPPSSARCWRWRAKMNDGLPPNGNSINQNTDINHILHTGLNKYGCNNTH